MNFLNYLTHSEEETRDLGIKLSKSFKCGQTVCLNGEIGAGKTAFVKGVLKGLNYKEEVTSPTFSLCHQYIADINVFHLDLYRINNYDDLYSIGFFDIDTENSIVFIEWAEIVSKYLNEFININFSYGKDINDRIIEVNNIFKIL
ncbi:MAG: tsaE [Clostridia bacterium]|nr:tsaE [Clostridia bacterium]